MLKTIFKMVITDNQIAFPISEKSRCDQLEIMMFLSQSVSVSDLSRIQICPQYLESAMSKQFKTKKDYPSAFFSTLTVQLALLDVPPEDYGTPMDLVSLFDTTMVHEVSAPAYKYHNFQSLITR